MPDFMALTRAVCGVALSLATALVGCGGGSDRTGTADLRAAATSAPVTTASGPLEDAELEAALVQTARNLRQELSLSPDAEAVIVEASRRSWRGVEAEVKARTEALGAGLDEASIADLLEERQAALDAELLKALGPDDRAKFAAFLKGGE